jgi:hypothetical protein
MHRTWVIASMIVAAALTRLVPHWPNFAPIVAMGLFGAAYFQRRSLAIIVPLLAMFISDMGLQLVQSMHLYDSWLATGRGFYRAQWVVYGTIALITCGGFVLRKHRSILPIGACVLAGSLTFFLLTNLGVWALGHGVRYPHTAAGLLECYVAAVPFFHYTVLGDLTYSVVLFGGYALLLKWSAQPAPVQPESVIVQ